MTGEFFVFVAEILRHTLYRLHYEVSSLPAMLMESTARHRERKVSDNFAKRRGSSRCIASLFSSVSSFNLVRRSVEEKREFLSKLRNAFALCFACPSFYNQNKVYLVRSRIIILLNHVDATNSQRDAEMGESLVTIGKNWEKIQGNRMETG